MIKIIFLCMVILILSVFYFKKGHSKIGSQEFYSQRYYPIQKNTQLEEKGTFIILKGAHYQSESDKESKGLKPFKKGKEELNGLFYINTQEPETKLKFWKFDPNNPNLISENSINSRYYKIFVQENRTYSGVSFSKLPKKPQFRYDFLNYSPTGDWYAFRYAASAYKKNKESQLFISDLTGKNTKVLLKSNDYIKEASWSNDNKLIVVSVVKDLMSDEVKPSYIINLIDRQSGEVKTIYQGENNYQNLLFTKNNKELIVTNNNLIESIQLNTGEGTELYQAEFLKRSITNEEGKTVKRKIDGFHSLQWSPNYEKLAFSYNRDLYTMNANGSGVIKVIKPEHFPNKVNTRGKSHYIWLADSQHLVYKDSLKEEGLTHSIRLSGTSFTRNYRLYMIDIETKKRTLLSKLHIDPELLGSFIIN